MDKSCLQWQKDPMQFDLAFFLQVLGLAMILEGLPYFIWAERMPSILQTLSQQKPSTLRILGIVILLCGLLLVFLGRRGGA